LAHDPMSMDSLIERTGLTAATLSSMLLTLELEGKVVVEHGRYTRTA
ncbi:MAG TPA: DNA-processing protein DprA, partial [Xylella fastidiosa subsp. pauca]